MRSLLSLDDTNPLIGQERLAAINPKPSPPPDDTMSHLINQLIESHASLIAYVTRLESRITELEARTWWSMLKAQVRSWFKP